MLDLVLIQPPNPVLTNPLMYSPLGLLYLTSAAQHSGFSVEVVDMRAGEQPVPKARYYGFSCTTPEIEYARKMAKTLKGKTIVGGAHPSLLPDDCKGDFDFVVRGEGELVLPQILRGLHRKGSVVLGQRIEHLDTLPFPDWDALQHPFSEELFPGERYGRGEVAATVIASRGCPFHCAFCANVMRNPVKFRSIANVMLEIKELMDRGVTHFRFEDDIFTLHPKFLEFCSKLSVLNINYKCHGRSDLLTKEMVKALKLSGCEEFGLGVESADNKVLALNKKKEDIIATVKAVKLLKEYGVRVKTYFIAGLPGETDETLRLNKEFFKACKPDKWTLSTFTPYPGSDIFNNPAKYGIVITEDDYSKWWNFNIQSYNHVINGQTPDEMWTRYTKLYKWLRGDSWK
jgi:anaerobic magnesium-protoporphyrin IX monomethyl ester cyclase